MMSRWGTQNISRHDARIQEAAAAEQLVATPTTSQRNYALGYHCCQEDLRAANEVFPIRFFIVGMTLLNGMLNGKTKSKPFSIVCGLKRNRRN